MATFTWNANEQTQIYEQNWERRRKIIDAGPMQLPLGLLYWSEDRSHSTYSLTIDRGEMRGGDYSHNVVSWYQRDAGFNKVIFGTRAVIGSFEFKEHYLNGGICLEDSSEFESLLRRDCIALRLARRRFNLAQIVRSTIDLEKWLNS